MIENMRTVGVCIGDWKIETSGGLGQGWLTTKSWKKSIVKSNDPLPNLMLDLQTLGALCS
jgi:hypothetical protein